MLQYSAVNENAHTILWGLVFGFATLNILHLGARHLAPARRHVHFGEILAILIVITALGMLAWELLHMFHILPIQLAPR